jgi:hypothetical protein
MIKVDYSGVPVTHQQLLTPHLPWVVGKIAKHLYATADLEATKQQYLHLAHKVETRESGSRAWYAVRGETDHC